jgi:hypothetical protein
MSVLKHLKNTGVNGIKSTTWSKEKLNTFENAYRQNFSDKNEVTLTYEPITIIAKVK